MTPVLAVMQFPNVSAPRPPVVVQPSRFTELVVAYDSPDYAYFKTPALAWNGHAYICLPRKNCGLDEQGGFRVWLTLSQVDRYSDWIVEHVSR